MYLMNDKQYEHMWPLMLLYNQSHLLRSKLKRSGSNSQDCIQGHRKKAHRSSNKSFKKKEKPKRPKSSVTGNIVGLESRWEKRLHVDLTPQARAFVMVLVRSLLCLVWGFLSRIISNPTLWGESPNMYLQMEHIEPNSIRWHNLFSKPSRTININQFGNVMTIVPDSKNHMPWISFCVSATLLTSTPLSLIRCGFLTFCHPSQSRSMGELQLESIYQSKQMNSKPQEVLPTRTG